MPPVSCSNGVPDVLAFQLHFQQRLLGLLAGEFVLQQQWHHNFSQWFSLQGSHGSWKVLNVEFSKCRT